MLAGVLRSSTNTGLNSELVNVFSTPLTITSNQPIAASESLNLKVISSGHAAQRWEISAAIAPTNETPESLIHSVLMGYSTSFYIRMPQPFLMSDTPYYTGTPAVNATVARGATALQVKNGTLLAGQFVNFGTATKVYLVTSSVDAGGGLYNITVQPPLRAIVNADTEIICGAKVKMRAIYSDDALLGVTYENGVLASAGTVKYKEKL
jgi:hypothetical protein